MIDPVHLLDLNWDELQGFLRSIDAESYRAGQVARWVYQELAADFSEMTDLPRALRERLQAEAVIYTAEAVAEDVSKDALTRKRLLKLADGRSIETVLMLYRERRTVCVSTQVGCALGCAFCATGEMGFTRNLAAGEIVEQVLHFGRWLRSAGEGQVTNVVFMGMGEPLANYDALWKAIRILHDPHLFALSARRMTVSTAGVAPRILTFAREGLPVGLAVSLNAADDQLRNRLMPINRRYPLAELLDAARQYTEITHRRITFEYALLDGVNDGMVDARRLAHLLRGMLCHVNLIPVNPVPGTDCRPSPRERAVAFKAELDRLHIPSTIRLGRGTDIRAACGQLKTGQRRGRGTMEGHK